MNNPWLKIPATDYEAHMALPQVAQAQALNKLMASALAQYAPKSLAVIGCSTGNGFERIDTSHTSRVVGVDINPAYLAILKSRFAHKISLLELIETDITAPDFKIDPVAMVFAGLVFEYVDVVSAMKNIARCLSPGGIFLSVLQLPSPVSAPVTPTRYKSLELLASIMNLVPPFEFTDICADVGLQKIKTDTVPLEKGKAFFVGFYQKDTVTSVPTDTEKSLKSTKVQFPGGIRYE